MFDSVLVIILFFLGASIGSFLNVLIDRLPKRESIFLSRSKCENCGRQLLWYDLVPLLSYVFLSGKCRYCKHLISLRLFLVEFLTGAMLVLLYFNFQFFQFFLYFIIFSCLIVIFFTDLEYGIIPDQILILLGSTLFLFNVFFRPERFFEFVLVGVSAFVVFLSIFLVTSSRGMGLGDVKLSFLIGFFLGFPTAIIAFYAAFLTGACTSLILIALGKKKFRKDTIAFGPFLVIGVFVAAIWGKNIFGMLNIP